MFINIAMFIMATIFTVTNYRAGQFVWTTAFTMVAIFYASCVVVEIARLLRLRKQKAGQ